MMDNNDFLTIYGHCDNLLNKLFTVVEMNSGAYLSSHEAARYISTTFTDTEVNNCLRMYQTQAE